MKEELRRKLNYFLDLYNCPETVPVTMMAISFDDDFMDKVKKEQDKIRLEIYDLLATMRITTIEDFLEVL